MIILRIAAFIILFFSVVFLPWPVTAFLTIMAITVFSWFWEAVIIGILVGGMYAFSNGSESLFSFFTLSFTAVLFAEEYLKQLVQGKNIVPRAIVAICGGASFVLLWLALNFINYSLRS